MTSNAKQPYTAPKVVVIGKIHELTLTPKVGSSADGTFTFNGSAVP
jgi:hypothetical protein